MSEEQTEYILVDVNKILISAKSYMNVLEVHVKPVKDFFIVTVLANDNGNIKAYQMNNLSNLDNFEYTINYVIRNCSKITFEDAKKIFPHIKKSEYDL